MRLSEYEIKMKITSQFDSGNIDVIDQSSIGDVQLNIRLDHQSEFFQWFHFRVQSEAGKAHRFRILNASKSAYADGWQDYQAVASYDRENWFRVDTVYENGELIISHTPELNATYYAYFTPYSYERHQSLIHQAQLSDHCELHDLGDTLDGRDIVLLVVGEEGESKKKAWITARQHPGETMAEWFVEGFLERLLDEEDGVARRVLEDTVFYIVPNMNPDGSVRGHLRTNAVGVNLNREWQTPSLEKSPEVYHVREKMLETGVDLYLDIHGDEALPYNFVAGCEGNPSYDDRLASLENAFKQALLTITPEFQDEYGYPKDEPGKANLTVASNWVGEQFRCLAYTIEMPFKDNADLPDAEYGWSDLRSMQFGRDVLAAVNHVIKQKM